MVSNIFDERRRSGVGRHRRKRRYRDGRRHRGEARTGNLTTPRRERRLLAGVRFLRPPLQNTEHDGTQQDEADDCTWYFRNKFENDEAFGHVVQVVGMWATVMTTLYPMEHVVKQYEAFTDAEIPDSIPEGWA